MDATCPNLRRLLPSCFAASWVLRTNDVTPKEMLFRFWLSFGVTLVGIDRGILFIIFFFLSFGDENGNKRRKYTVRPETKS